MSASHRLLVWAVLALSVALLAHGLIENHLFSQRLWTEIGRQRFLWFAAAYTVLAVVLLRVRPRLVPYVVGAAVILYSAAAVGSQAVLAVAFLAASLSLVGGFAAGLALAVTLISLTAALPIHYPAVYFGVLALPLLVRWRKLRFPTLPAMSRAETAALMAALFPLLCHWLVALKPEASADGLAMHLVIPARMAVEHRWAFDVERFTWAVMPMGGDWAFTAAYLLGGEAAARLFNLVVLGAIALTLLRLARRWVSMTTALCFTALFLTSPIVQLVTGSMFVENFWTLALIAALEAILRFHEERRSGLLYRAALFCGVAVAMKLGAIVFAGAFLWIAMVELLRKPWPRWLRALPVMLGVTMLFASIPYVTAWRVTGNPVFPFANTTFHSPHFDTREPFVDVRYRWPVSTSSIYDVAFKSSRHLEGLDGAFGFHWPFMLPVAAAIFGRRWGWPAGALTLAGLFCFFAVFLNQSYLRYIYPLLFLWSVPLMVAWARLDSRPLRAGLTAFGAAAYLLNLWFLPASGWYHKDFFLNQVFDAKDARRYLTEVSPERLIAGYLKRKGGTPRIAFLTGNAIGDLQGDIYTNSWHSHRFARELAESVSAEQDLALARRLAIEYFITVNPALPGYSGRVHTAEFLERYTDSEFAAGRFLLARLKDGYRKGGTAPAAEMRVALPKTYDDQDSTLSFNGPWVHDRFPDAANGTVTYTNRAGSTVSLRFSGTAVTWIFTRALNRGIAVVEVDGASQPEVDLFAPQTAWRSEQRFGPFPEGIHTLTIRVSGRRHPASSDSYVDVDQFVVSDAP